MTSLFSLLRRSASEERGITSLDDYVAALSEVVYNGYAVGSGVQQTLAGQPEERIPNDLTGYASGAYASNGSVFALMAVRMLVFSAVRFQWQQMNQGRPSALFGTRDLSALENPWPGGTTQDLLLRMILDADLAGNSYWTRLEGEVVRLRPDWVGIVLEPRRHRGGTVGYRRIGYTYHEGGVGNADPVPFLADEVAHFAPLPDPLATYRGMSWLTPVIREITGDKAMGRHKNKFFENGATPNMVISLAKEMPFEKFQRFKAEFEKEHKGVRNAYKTLLLGGGADVTVVGSDFKQIDFKQIQGHGETRIAAAAGVPPVIAGFSEGLQAATYSNYAQARRRFADGTMHPLWSNAAGSLATIARAPVGSRLWYDARDVPFLREDKKDSAEIQQIKAGTIARYVESGFTAESAVAAVDAEDASLLKHTGLFSVQLQPPGANAPSQPTTDDDAEQQEA